MFFSLTGAVVNQMCADTLWVEGNHIRNLLRECQVVVSPEIGFGGKPQVEACYEGTSDQRVGQENGLAHSLVLRVSRKCIPCERVAIKANHGSVRSGGACVVLSFCNCSLFGRNDDRSTGGRSQGKQRDLSAGGCLTTTNKKKTRRGFVLRLLGQ